jgi:hypothetical protein
MAVVKTTPEPEQAEDIEVEIEEQAEVGVQKEMGGSFTNQKQESDLQVEQRDAVLIEQQSTSSVRQNQEEKEIDMEKLEICTRLGCSDLMKIPESQYSFKSVSSCTIMALEAALRSFYPGSMVDERRLRRVLEIAAQYELNQHTGVQDVFPYVSRFNLRMSIFDTMQTFLDNIEEITKRMAEFVESQNKPLAAILTKPPETCMISMNINKQILFFDSHARPHLWNGGAACLIFENAKEFLRFVRSHLWQSMKFDDLDGDEAMLAIQQFNLIEATLLELKPDAPPITELLDQEFERLVLEAEMKELNSGISSAETCRHKDNCENAACSHAHSKGRDIERSIRSEIFMNSLQVLEGLTHQRQREDILRAIGGRYFDELNELYQPTPQEPQRSKRNPFEMA